MIVRRYRCKPLPVLALWPGMDENIIEFTNLFTTTNRNICIELVQKNRETTVFTGGGASIAARSFSVCRKIVGCSSLSIYQGHHPHAAPDQRSGTLQPRCRSWLSSSPRTTTRCPTVCGICPVHSSTTHSPTLILISSMANAGLGRGKDLHPRRRRRRRRA